MVVPDESKKAQTLQLIAEKDAIERKIQEYGQILETNNVGMTGSLVDAEGFPRNDIDVYQVRHARHQIICLQNDLKALMKQIEKGIEEIHADARREEQGQTSPKFAGFSESEGGAEATEFELRPFIKVDLVSSGSPAEDAGLMANDRILEFGSINCKNFVNLNTIAEVVKHREKQRIQVKVKRGEQVLDLNLIPSPWRGRGLLGCNIVPVDPSER
ncbi:26S proteasome non-ATPase regulatory subunit 9 [Hermetia illucens]|nr:26S proteasome non-ATPase regulatory subunit 9 [Hermetia illucens]